MVEELKNVTVTFAKHPAKGKGDCHVVLVLHVNNQNKRQIIIIISTIEVLISAAILLILFGFFPIDISELNIPRRTVGIVAGLWFASSLAILIYMLTKTDTLE